MLYSAPTVLYSRTPLLTRTIPQSFKCRCVIGNLRIPITYIKMESQKNATVISLLSNHY